MPSYFVPKRFISNIIAPACKNDAAIMNAFSTIPRSLFVGTGMEHQSFEDKALPIGLGQTISQPSTVARMLYLLDLQPTDIVLEIGSGSGFVTALLSQIVAHVYAVELIPQLKDQAEKLIDQLGVGSKIDLRLGDGAVGFSDAAPFDKIIASAAAQNLPPELVEQLKDDGILIIPIQNTLMRYRKIEGRLISEETGAAKFVDFVNT